MVVKKTTLCYAACVLVVVIAANYACAMQVQDIVRIKGAESSTLVGMGLVVGLNSTGDGGKFMPAMRQLAGLMNKLGDPTASPYELKDAKNVAIVTVTVKLPGNGVTEGDQLDVQVSSIAASSLKGGRLFLTPLQGPIPGSGIYAFASGGVVIEDESTPTSGVVKAGATMTRNVLAKYMDNNGFMTLVLDNPKANWQTAQLIATMINDSESPDGPPIAYARDPKNVIVYIPFAEQSYPGSFINDVLGIPIDPEMIRSEARVVINQRTGTIVVTGTVELSPVLITHGGLTITSISQPTGGARGKGAGEAEEENQSKLGRARMADLLALFNQYQLPSQDRIAIIKEIYRTGKLHAKLILED